MVPPWVLPVSPCPGSVVPPFLRSLLRDAGAALRALLINTNFWRGSGGPEGIADGRCQARWGSPAPCGGEHMGPCIFYRVHPGLFLFLFYFLPPPLAVKVPVDKELVPGR